jgi:hypothetical protein
MDYNEYLEAMASESATPLNIPETVPEQLQDIDEPQQESPRPKREKPKPPKNPLVTIRADKLDQISFDPLYYIWAAILSIGVAIIASLPKVGKSWWVLDLCLSVATGTPFLDQPTKRGDVLYLGLEDSNRRLQDRARKVYKKPLPNNLYFATEAGTIKGDLIPQLYAFILEHPNVKLIVIDIFEFVRDIAEKNASDYRHAGQEIKKLGDFARDNELCIIIVHHERKSIDPSNPYANILGSVAIQGTVDTMFILTKEDHRSNKATLHFKGRDIGEDAYNLEFDTTAFKWKMRGKDDPKDDYPNNPVVKVIRKLVNNPEGYWRGTVSDLLLTETVKHGHYIPLTEAQLGKELNRLKKDLHHNDGICHMSSKNGGAGGRWHSFSKRRTTGTRTPEPDDTETAEDL